MKQKSDIKMVFYLFDNCKSNSTVVQTEKHCRAVSQGTHIRIGVNTAKDDVKLLIKMNKV